MLINVKVAILRSQLLLFIIVFQPNTCLFVSCFGSVPLLWVLLSVATAFEGRATVAFSECKDAVSENVEGNACGDGIPFQLYFCGMYGKDYPVFSIFFL